MDFELGSPVLIASCDPAMIVFVTPSLGLVRFVCSLSILISFEDVNIISRLLAPALTIAISGLNLIGCSAAAIPPGSAEAEV